MTIIAALGIKERQKQPLSMSLRRMNSPNLLESSRSSSADQDRPGSAR